ncbi:MAG: SH3 domain-containing protein [Actinopolymorphaceae bacterium]
MSHRIRITAIVRGIVVTAATAVLLSATLLAVAPASQAHAATSYQGRVTATLNVRSAPTTAAADVGTLRSGATISIQCKVFGPSVGGNSLWYKLSTTRWVTARYVSNIGPAPRFCGDGQEYEGRAAAFVNVRSGPNTANAVVSSAPQGTFLALVCKVDSQVVDGNPRWYQLTGDGGGQWVAARYVSNVGSAPPYC